MLFNAILFVIQWIQIGIKKLILIDNWGILSFQIMFHFFFFENIWPLLYINYFYKILGGGGNFEHILFNKRKRMWNNYSFVCTINVNSFPASSFPTEERWPCLQIDSMIIIFGSDKMFFIEQMPKPKLRPLNFQKRND
jgi:hypothetical protein